MQLELIHRESSYTKDDLPFDDVSVTATRAKLNLGFRHAHIDASGWNRQFVRDTLRALRAQADEEFEPLADRLTHETRWSSSSSAIKRHPAYAALVAMGKPAAKKIIERMRNGDVRVQWFPILKAITESDPVRPELRGRIEEMAAVWVQWAETGTPSD